MNQRSPWRKSSFSPLCETSKALMPSRNEVGLARFEIELVQRAVGPAGITRGELVTLQQEQHAGLPSLHGDVVARGDRQRQDALADVLEIDRRTTFFTGSLLSLSGLRPASSRRSFVSSCRRPFFFVALGRERRRRPCAEPRGTRCASRAVEAGHVEPSGDGPTSVAGGEVEVLAVLIETANSASLMPSVTWWALPVSNE